MTWNRFENVSSTNPMPVQEVAGTYNAKEQISASNPLPVMEVEGAYSNYENVSSANPQPVAIIADSGTYTRYEDYSDTNAFPVKFITGQTYDPRFDVSETNPWPVLVVSGGAPEYEGPLDIVGGAVVAYGVRALSAAMLGADIFRLRRDSDNAEMDFASDAITGDAPLADIATWLGGANGFVVMLYDQSGNGISLSVPGSSVDYPFNPDSQGGRPAVAGQANSALWSTELVDFPALTFSQMWVVKGEPNFSFNNNPGQIVDIAAGASAYTYVKSSGSDYLFEDYSGQADDSYHLIDAVFDAASGSFTVDGVALTSTPDASGTPTAPINDCTVRTVMSAFASPEFQEWIVWNSAASAENRIAIRQNLATYYGITLP